MTNLTKSFAVGLTALSMSSALFAGISQASEWRRTDHVRGVRDEGHRGGHGRDIATGMAVGFGLALISNALAERQSSHPHTTSKDRYVGRGDQVIGDDPKGTPKTVSKAAACKWVVVKVSVTNYGTAATDKEKKEWFKKFEEKAVDYAKQFVKDNASKMGKTILKAIVEDTTITRAMDVLITYACVDENNDVLATKVVGPIQDQYAMHWWTGSKIDEGNEAGKAAAIAKNKPTMTVTAKK